MNQSASATTHLARQRKNKVLTPRKWMRSGATAITFRCARCPADQALGLSAPARAFRGHVGRTAARLAAQQAPSAVHLGQRVDPASASFSMR